LGIKRIDYPDVVAAEDQGVNYEAPDESGSACHEHIHGAVTTSCRLM
jgi:hypothetical protein